MSLQTTEDAIKESQNNGHSGMSTGIKAIALMVVVLGGLGAMFLITTGEIVTGIVALVSVLMFALLLYLWAGVVAQNEVTAQYIKQIADALKRGDQNENDGNPQVG